MPRRGRGGRFVKGGSRARPPARRRSVRSRYARVRAAGRTYYGRAKAKVGWFGMKARSFTRGAPNTVLGRPVSRMVAPTLAVGAEAKLVFTPLSNGDSWMGRANSAMQSIASAAQSGNWTNANWFGSDAQGNNIGSIFALQVEQNAPSAVVLALESVALGAIGRFLGA